MKTFHMVRNALVGGAFTLVAVTSHAAITAAQLAPISDDVGDSVEALITWTVALMAVVLGAMIGIKLVKKFANRAT